MPRIRTVKPEFWLNEELALLPPETRLLAIGLLNQSDDEGYFRAHPTLLKAAIFPFSEPSVSPHDMLIQLQKASYISLCIGGDGKPYGFVINFAKHQRVNRPTPSKIKELCDFSDDSVSIHGVISDGSRGERKGKERNMEQGKEHGNANADEDVNSVFDYWVNTMNSPNSKLTADRKAKIKARLKTFSVDDICKAIDGCKRSEFHMGKNDRNTAYNSIEFICRNDSKIEFFHNVGQSTPDYSNFLSNGFEI